MSMSVSSGTSRGARPDINVTPLVDVVLVLLIIFMVVTPLLEKELPMRLPTIEETAIAEPPPPDEDNLVILVTAKDEVKFNGQPIQVAEIGDKVAPFFKGKTDKALFFTAEDDARYELAIDVLDHARAAGIRTIAYLTEPLEQAPAAPGATSETPAPSPQ